MENKGLIFIPDISGFTRFVNEPEIGHSRQIIQELLELLVNANQIGLEISEIEGDAILFYKYGEVPGLKQLSDQVEKMFCSFHSYLAAYENRRICQCAACKSAANLTLKVITHYGEFTGYNVKNFNKLIGKDVIIAHQLLKNDIDHHEYWLVTDRLTPTKLTSHLPEWINWNNSSKQTESGQISYQYTYLGQLKNKIPPETAPQLEIPNKVKVMSISKDFNAEINNLFFSTINFNFRGQWQVGVKKADQVSHILPQVGTRHRCVLDKGQAIMYTSSYSYSPDKIIYSETEEGKKHAGYFTFEKIEENKTKITFDVYVKKNIIVITIFRLLMKKKMEINFRKSLDNLERMMQEIKIIPAKKMAEA